jgi:hypothetical protein
LEILIQLLRRDIDKFRMEFHEIRTKFYKMEENGTNNT